MTEKTLELRVKDPREVSWDKDSVELTAWLHLGRGIPLPYDKAVGDKDQIAMLDTIKGYLMMHNWRWQDDPAGGHWVQQLS